MTLSFDNSTASSSANEHNIDTQIEVINKLGLHARACGKLVEVTTNYVADIRIGRDNQLVDAKNIMSLLMLGAGKGTILRLCIHGTDASDALETIVQLFSDRFYEAE